MIRFKEKIIVCNVNENVFKLRIIRSRAHNICEDDKRFILEDGIHTFALKHYKIKCF